MAVRIGCIVSLLVRPYVSHWVSNYSTSKFETMLDTEREHYANKQDSSIRRKALVVGAGALIRVATQCTTWTCLICSTQDQQARRAQQVVLNTRTHGTTCIVYVADRP